MRTAVGTAHGKLILSGEHFVVYGNPCIALPLVSRRVEVSLEPTPLSTAPPAEFQAHLKKLLAELGVDPELPIRIDSTLPVGAGLGSSAALAVALIRALMPQKAEELEWLRGQAHRLERLAHGNPSGVDDAVATYACPVFYTRADGVERLGVPELPKLWVGVTRERTSTMAAVAQVADLAKRKSEWFAQKCHEARLATLRSKEALESANWPELGQVMSEDHSRLQSIGVSTSALDTLVDAARRGGAYGAKLTGGGLGGAVIALAPPTIDMHPVLSAAGAVEVIRP